jgi:hypothetical protein
MSPEEALARHDKATEQVRRCALIALATDHPDDFIAAVDRFEKYFAEHPEEARP